MQEHKKHILQSVCREEFAPPLLPQVKPAAAETDILQQILNEWMNENNVIALIMTTLSTHLWLYFIEKSTIF